MGRVDRKVERSWQYNSHGASEQILNTLRSGRKEILIGATLRARLCVHRPTQRKGWLSKRDPMQAGRFTAIARGISEAIATFVHR